MTIVSRARLAWSAAALLAGVALSTPAQAVCVDNQTPFTAQIETQILIFEGQNKTTKLPPNRRTCVPRTEPLYKAVLQAAPSAPMMDKDGQMYYSTGETAHMAHVVTNNTTFRITHHVYQMPTAGTKGVVAFKICRDC